MGTHEQGMTFEADNLEVLKSEGLLKYVTFHNPVTSLWNYIRHSGSGMGVDLIMVIGAFTLYIEESFCSHVYPYRQRWWNKCRAQRFNQYVSDRYHRQIVLSNFPENFKGVNTGSIILYSLTTLLALIRSLLTLLPLHTTTLNTNMCIAMDNEPSDEQILAYLKTVVRPRWIDERLKQLEKDHIEL
jgi:hypothetical protein